MSTTTSKSKVTLLEDDGQLCLDFGLASKGVASQLKDIVHDITNYRFQCEFDSAIWQLKELAKNLENGVINISFDDDKLKELREDI